MNKFSFLYQNKSLKGEHYKRMYIHQKKLQQIKVNNLQKNNHSKTVINSINPVVKMPPNFKKCLKKKEQNQQIAKNNIILLQKIHRSYRKKNFSTSLDNRFPKTLNKYLQLQNQNKIQKQNLYLNLISMILDRIRQQKSVYSIEKLLKKWQKNEQITSLRRKFPYKSQHKKSYLKNYNSFNSSESNIQKKNSAHYSFIKSKEKKQLLSQIGNDQQQSPKKLSKYQSYGCKTYYIQIQIINKELTILVEQLITKKKWKIKLPLQQSQQLLKNLNFLNENLIPKRIAFEKQGLILKLYKSTKQKFVFKRTSQIKSTSKKSSTNIVEDKSHDLDDKEQAEKRLIKKEFEESSLGSSFMMDKKNEQNAYITQSSNLSDVQYNDDL